MQNQDLKLLLIPEASTANEFGCPNTYLEKHDHKATPYWPLKHAKPVTSPERKAGLAGHLCLSLLWTTE